MRYVYNNKEWNNKSEELYVQVEVAAHQPSNLVRVKWRETIYNTKRGIQKVARREGFRIVFQSLQQFPLDQLWSGLPYA